MKYEICYVHTSTDDFIAAIDPNGEEAVKILDAIYFQDFRNDEGEYDLAAIEEYITAIEDVSSWEEIEDWHTAADIENLDGDCDERNNIIFRAELEI